MGAIEATRDRDQLKLLRSIPLFAALGANGLGLVAQKATRRLARRNELIFAKGDAGDALIAILSGEVKITAVSIDGREVLFDILHPGDAFGEIALLDGGPRSADATAISSCELLCVHRADFLSLLAEDRSLSIKIIEILCERLRYTNEQVEGITLFGAAGRLAKALLRLAGSPENALAPSAVKATQQQISQMVGLSREMTNRQLQQFSRFGVIELKRGAIVVVAPAKLAAIAAGAVG